jgi:hypothetical protein
VNKSNEHQNDNIQNQPGLSINDYMGRDVMNTTSMNRASSSSIKKSTVKLNVIQPKYFDIKTRQIKDIVD